jgi:hypothetical protein
MINEYSPQKRTLRVLVRLMEKLSGDKLAFLGACLLAVLLAMTVLTSYYLPKTYGEIVSAKEFYPANKPFTFMVELGSEEYWRVKSWTDTKGTEYDVTLTGHPFDKENPETTLLNNSFTYSWTLSLNSSNKYFAYEFNLKIPQSPYGNKWVFNILVEGHGSIYIIIRKFDRNNFHMFFIPDVIGTVVISVIIILIIKQRIRLETNVYQF